MRRMKISWECKHAVDCYCRPGCRKYYIQPPWSVTKSIHEVEEGAGTGEHGPSAIYSRRKFLQKASTSCLYPSQLQRRSRWGGTDASEKWFKLNPVRKSKRRHPPRHLWSYRGRERSTQSAKADITSIMKANWIALSLPGSMGISRAFPVCVCKLLFLPARKINGHYHESSSHRDWITSAGIQHDM